LNTTYVLEDHIQTGIQIFHDAPEQDSLPTINSKIVEFYNLQEISHKQIKFSTSLLFQIQDRTKTCPQPSTNRFSRLYCPDHITPNYPMTSDDNIPQPHKDAPTNSSESQWVSNIDIESLTDIIAEQIKKDGPPSEDQSNDIPPTSFQPPRPIHSQYIRFNLIRHCEVSNNMTTLQLFKSFLTTLHHADSSTIILPFLSSIQHYSSLHNLKQIKEVEENRMYQYFKLYYQKQHYLISGSFHISSNFSLSEIQALPEVDERLDTHKYHICQCLLARQRK